MPGTTLETIKKKAEALTIDEHIKLLEILARQLGKKCVSEKKQLDWKELYGLGKGLWKGEDAQDYVNSLRDDRI